MNIIYNDDIQTKFIIYKHNLCKKILEIPSVTNEKDLLEIKKQISDNLQEVYSNVLALTEKQELYIDNFLKNSNFKGGEITIPSDEML